MVQDLAVQFVEVDVKRDQNDIRDHLFMLRWRNLVYPNPSFNFEKAPSAWIERLIR